ncbi:Serine/threonine protein kinase [Forsythia ovata]|uniref:Serine/threonine protein kinase n=1 Tax=Forsythia ovata TaxID=205694 RepID=A0ABD1T6U7_9LAMI
MSGFLPKSFGNMSYLTLLDLHRNGFTGEVPPEFGNLAQLEYLDISGNKLCGQIPDEICGVQNLFFLDFSNNRLEGRIPSNGICSNLTKASLAGNKNLCGGIVGLRSSTLLLSSLKESDSATFSSSTVVASFSPSTTGFPTFSTSGSGYGGPSFSTTAVVGVSTTTKKQFQHRK